MLSSELEGSLDQLDLGDDAEPNEVDAFFNDENTPDAPSEDLLRVMKGFVKDHCRSLATVKEALSGTVSEAWSPENNIVCINMEPHDTQSILQMVRTENHQLNKVVVVLATLVEEVGRLDLLASEKFYGGLTMFGDTPEGMKPESNEVMMGSFLPFLADLINFVKRIYSVTRNIVNQLACLYHERLKMWQSTFKHVHVVTIFEALGKLCRVLLTLDYIILDNTAIKTAWSQYKRMIKYVRADPDRYGIAQKRLRQFESFLVRIDKDVVQGKLFQGLLTMDFEVQGSEQKVIAGNRVFAAEFATVIKDLFKRNTGNLNTEGVETYTRHQMVELYCLFALSRGLFRETKLDKAMYKKMWSVQKMIPIVPLYGRAVWTPDDFLTKYVQAQVQGLNPPPQAIEKHRGDFLESLDSDFVKQTEDLYINMCMWMVRIESELVPGKKNNMKTVLNARSKLILNGILIANQLRNLVTTMIHIHLLLEKPFKAQNVRSMALCAEMLKAIEQTYLRRMSMIAENISAMIGQTSQTLSSIFEPIKSKLDKKNRLDFAKMDVLSAVNLSLTLLSRAPSKERAAALGVALSIAQIKGILQPDHQKEVEYQTWKLNLLASWQKTVEDVCNCDFLYMVSNLVPTFFKDILNHPDQVNRLSYLFAAFKDSTRLLSCAVFHAEAATQAYKKEVLNHFTENIVDPLARAVETDLRLHIHSVVLEQKNLVTETSKDVARFLNLKPKHFFDVVLDINHMVTCYLDKTFYNLVALTLSDWKVYAEMRNLANEKYGLKMTEVHLPGASHYSDSLDILEIMRKIHVFVAHYNYNMNIQIFIEKAYDQKHLNSINIFHIAQAIRTHGTGIMNTTVNFTYQFLVHKFELFSEFLFDDYIKSWLLKDIRHWRSEKQNLDNKYPYERAERFCKDIRKLGIQDNMTYLDQFRNQITEIGNALGYVRMVRSGGLHHLANAIQFVPDLDQIPTFASGDISAASKHSATNLDEVLEDLSSSFAEGTEYFQILVKIFAPVFNTPTNLHLKNFYMIVPPLMLCFVEKMVVQKDRLVKRGQKDVEAAFTDDGFALGLAYILRVLDQDSVFDSLHWFDSVTETMNSKKKEIASKPVQDEDRTFSPTIKRTEVFQREFELLFYSFSGARIFFKDYVADKEKEEKGEEKVDDAPSSAEGVDGAPVVPADATAGAMAPPPPPPGGAPPPPPGPPPPPPPPR